MASYQLFRKLADWEDGKLVSQNNHFIEVWMSISFIESEREKQWENEKAIYLAKYLIA